ncbi:apolipoprotein N-acyltransferase [Chitinophaga lutea]
MNPFLRKRLPLLLSLLSGCILWAAWPTSSLTLLIFIGFMPLLAITDRVYGRGAYFGLIYLALWIWNTGTTWWVGNTPVPASGVFANAFNALLMSIPLMGFKIAREKHARLTSYLALAVYWLTFEYVHSQWELTWPWLTLGNAFAMFPDLVQWYEFTGTSGGSLYILVANIFVYEAVLQFRNRPRPLYKWAAGWRALLWIVLPMAISLLIKPTPEHLAPGDTPKTPIVIVQPNVDPYDEKFSEGTASAQLEWMLALTHEKVTAHTQYAIWPETALFTSGAWEHELNEQPEVIRIRAFLQQYPNLKIISGASTLKRYPSLEEATPSVRTSADGTLFYDAFNSSVQIDTSANVQIYHKSKLVPGVEITPYVHYFPFMKKLALDFGGITGSYGLTPGVSLFTDPVSGTKVYNAICYESVYGELVANKVREGADFIAVSTNDGWWGNTQGHKQHMAYARLRAIETRRYVVRSANTGISCAINIAGQVDNNLALPYWTPGVLAAGYSEVRPVTFYVRYCPLISKTPPVLCILLLLYLIVIRVRRKAALKL